jgi:RNA polymerase sigma-70 factor (ECF subfamily)
MAKPTAPNHDAFLQAYDTLSDAIFRHCYYRCYDREKAQELMQECFMKTWERIAAGDEILNLKAFLYRVAGNLVIDHSRRKKADSLEAMAESSGFDPVGSGAAEIETAAESRLALALLDRLDDRHRQAVTLRYVEGLSPREIAEITGETENAVSVRIHRGLAQLRQHAL